MNLEKYKGCQRRAYFDCHFFPGKRSVAPSAQIPKFEFLAGEMKLQLFATFNAVLNCWGMIGWWTTSIIPKKFKTAPKVPSSNLGFWELGATDLFPGKNLAIKKSPSLAPLVSDGLFAFPFHISESDSLTLRLRCVRTPTFDG